MGDTHRKGAIEMECSIERCSGNYEEQQVTHTVRQKGEVVVIDHVPAEVCALCGDVLLKPETVRRIEKLLHAPTRPSKRVPLYEYA
jgi:YgiT-type zinc finger domain-containing protein